MCVAYSTSFRSMALLGVAGVIGGAQSERPHAPAREPGPKSPVECSGRRAAPAGAVHFGRRLLSRTRVAPPAREPPPFWADSFGAVTVPPPWIGAAPSRLAAIVGS